MSLKELGLKLGDAFTLKALLETQRRRESYSRSYKRKLVPLNASTFALKIILARPLKDLQHEEFN